MAPQKQPSTLATTGIVCAAFVAAAGTGLALLSRNASLHLAPAMTPDALPPAAAFHPIISLVAGLDSLARAVTPPNLYLFRQLMGYMHTVQIYTAAELRVADALAAAVDGRLTSEQLAAAVTDCAGVATGEAACDAVALRLGRVLRALAAYGVFAEVSPDVWANTDTSAFLQAEHPHSIRSTALNFGGVQYRMMAYLPDTVRHGTASFQSVFGEEFWAWYREHPAEHAIFDETMTQLGRIGGADAAIAHDFPWGARLHTLVDVGGGYGDMLAEILAANPGLVGAVFDQPAVIARAVALWKEERRGIDASRVSLVAGDMFDPATLPSPRNVLAAAPPAARAGKCEHTAVPGAVGYSFRDIVHDWPDEDVVRIFKSVRAALRDAASLQCYDDAGAPLPLRPARAGEAVPTDTLLLVARLIRPGVGFVQSFGTNDADTVMLGAFGTTAGERSEEHFRRLMTQSGLTLTRLTPTRSHYFIVEAVAA